MTEATTNKTYEDGVNAERVRIMTLILKEQQSLISNYKNTIKQTGGLLTASMTFAYTRGLNDIFKLLNKPKDSNEKSVQA